MSESTECRIGLYLDLENLVHDYREVRDWAGAVQMVSRIVTETRCAGTVVTAVASCDVTLSRTLAFPLAELGVRVFAHGGGTDAADRQLISRLETEVPSSVDTVVLGSGDHIFTPTVQRLRAGGRKVIVAVADTKNLARELRLAADAMQVFMYPAPLRVAA